MTRILGRLDISGNHSPLPRIWRTTVAEVDVASEARSNAMQILVAARQQGRSIVESAMADAGALIADERQQAWQLGYAQGREQAQSEYLRIAQPLAELVGRTVVAHEASTRNLDEAVVELVMALTRLVVRHEIASNPDTILHVARAALGELSIEGTVSLRVHPEDAALLSAQLHVLALPATTETAIVADPSLGRGDCLIVCGAGQVNATIEKQLERLGSQLHEQLSTS